MATTHLHRTPRHRRRSRGRAAFTLLEIMITMSIMVLVLTMISAGFLRMLRQERTNTMLLNMISDTQKLRRSMRELGGSATRFIVNNNRTLVIRQGAGQEARLQFEDDDNDFTTIDDNRIVFIRDAVNFIDDDVLIVQNVSPPNIGGGGPLTDGSGNNAAPIFTTLATNDQPFLPVQIQFVIGDYAADVNAKCHAVTGYGYQSYTFRMSMSPRNAAR